MAKKELKELLERNEKLREIHEIITKRANTPTVRQLVADKVAEGFGKDAPISSVPDLIEYFDEMTNTTTMYGSKVEDSTLFDPIKNLVYAYLQDFEKLGELYAKNQEAFQKAVENAHKLKENYRNEQYAHARSEREVFELMEKVSKLKAQNDYNERLIAATELSSRERAENMLKAEDEAKSAQRGAEVAIAKSKELEEKYNLIVSEYDKVVDANKAANAELDKTKNELVAAQGAKGKWKGTAIAVGCVAALFGAAAFAHLHDWNSVSKSESITELGEFAKYVSNSLESIKLADGKVVELYLTSKDGLAAGKDALAAEEQTYTVQDALAKVDAAYEVTETELAGLETIGKNIDKDIIELSTAGDSEAANYAIKALGYSADVTKSLDGVKSNYATAIEALQVANQVSKESLNAKIEALEAEKAELETYVATLEAENHEYAEKLDAAYAENQALFQSYTDLCDFFFETYDISMSDCYIEDGYLQTLAPLGYEDIKVSEEGLEAYNKYQTSGEDTVLNSKHFVGITDVENATKGFMEAEAQSRGQAEEEHTAGNQGQGQEVVAGDDAGTTPSDSAPSEDGNIVQNPTENEQGEGSEPTGSEVSDGEAEEEQGEPAGYGNNGRG